MRPIADSGLDRITRWELPLCRLCHEWSGVRLRRFFAGVSVAGDGPLYLAVLALLLVSLGQGGVPVVVQALAVAACGHLLYRGLKRRTARLRPLDLAESGFTFVVPPLDRYSFPSGHTLHAVAFAAVVSGHLPVFAWLLVPFAVLVAASRVILGLHYPTDVVAGAFLGALLAWLSFLV